MLSMQAFLPSTSSLRPRAPPTTAGTSRDTHAGSFRRRSSPLWGQLDFIPANGALCLGHQQPAGTSAVGFFLWHLLTETCEDKGQQPSPRPRLDFALDLDKH